MGRRNDGIVETLKVHSDLLTATITSWKRRKQLFLEADVTTNMSSLTRLTRFRR